MATKTTAKKAVKTAAKKGPNAARAAAKKPVKRPPAKKPPAKKPSRPRSIPFVVTVIGPDAMTLQEPGLAPASVDVVLFVTETLTGPQQTLVANFVAAMDLSVIAVRKGYKREPPSE